MPTSPLYVYTCINVYDVFSLGSIHLPAYGNVELFAKVLRVCVLRSVRPGEALVGVWVCVCGSVCASVAVRVGV